MPRLAGREFSRCPIDTAALYSRGETTRAEGVKRQGVLFEDPETKTIDWVRAYEFYLRILSHVDSAHHLLNPRNIHAALPQIEAVSRIAAAQRANIPRSALTIAFKVLFSDYGSSLWIAIARDPARWLKIAENLHHEGIYKEALTHLIGQYPSFSTDLEDAVPIGDASMSTILRLGREKLLYKMSIDSGTPSLDHRPQQTVGS